MFQGFNLECGNLVCPRSITNFLLNSDRDCNNTFKEIGENLLNEFQTSIKLHINNNYNDKFYNLNPLEYKNTIDCRLSIMLSTALSIFYGSLIITTILISILTFCII